MKELASVLRSLAPNPADAVARAYRELEPARESLIAELGLPSPDLWPASHSVADRTGPLGDATIRVADYDAAFQEQESSREIAFRVRGDLRLRGFGVGAGSGFDSLLVEGVEGWMWVAVFVLGFAGYKLGQRVESTRCSCCDHRVRMALDQDRCSFCDTRLLGTIENVDDRIEATDDVAPCRNRTPKSKIGKGPRWRTTTIKMNPATT